MAWGAAIGAIGSYLAARDQNNNSGSSSSTNMYNQSDPWAPTVPGRYNGINAASDLFRQRFGTPDQRTWVPNNPDGTPGQDPSNPGDLAKDPRNANYPEPDQGIWGGVGGTSGLGAENGRSQYGNGYGTYNNNTGQWDPSNNPLAGRNQADGHFYTTPGEAGTGFNYDVPRPGATPGINLPGANSGAPLPTYGGGGGGRTPSGVTGGPGSPYQPNAGGGGTRAQRQAIRAAGGSPNRQGNGGGGGGNGGGGGGGMGRPGGGSSSTTNNQNPYTDQLFQAGQNYQGPAGLSDLRDMAGNVNNDNPYLDDAYNANSNYHGSAAMQELMGREMGRNANGYESDDFNAAQDRMNNYQGPEGLTAFRDRLLRTSDPGAQQATGGGGGGTSNTPRYNPNAAAAYMPGGGQGGGVGANDPSLGNGQGTYDPYVQQTLRAEDPWSSRLKAMADAQYSMSPETQAMLDMQQRRMQEQLAPELAANSFQAESSGRFGSDAYQMMQAQTAGRVAQSVGDMRTQMGAADLGQFRQGQQFALGQGSQNYNNALGIGAQLQNNRADNQTSMANQREASNASANASAAAGAMQQAALTQQGQLAREQMALQAFGMQGEADQFSIGGGMDAAQFGMNYDAQRTGQLMDFTNQQSGYEQQGLNNNTQLAGIYGDQNLQSQQLAMTGMANAVQYGGQADALRFGTMGDAAGLQNQWGLGMAGINQQADAARRSANLQRQGMNQASQQHQQDMNFNAQMQQWQMGQEGANQQALLNWQAGQSDADRMNQWEQNNFQYNQTAPMDFLGNYAGLMNAFGQGGGSSHQYGTGQASGPYQSPYGAAISGGAWGYSAFDNK